MSRLASAAVTVLFLHGFADTRNRSGILGPDVGPPALHYSEPAALAQATRDAIPGSYVVNAVFGNRGDAEDMRSGTFGRFEDSIVSTCAQLTADARLVASDRVHMIGLSQGGLALRVMLQHPACDKIRAASLISIAGPQAGISALPYCLALTEQKSGPPCRQIMQLLRGGVYSPEAQNGLLAAQYMIDPLIPFNDFVAKGTWLSRVNGWSRDIPAAQAAYAKRRILSLHRMVLWRFAEDTIMVPGESAWFSHLSQGRLVRLWEQPGWAEDVLGLRALNQSGRLILKTDPGQHTAFLVPWFVEHVIPYLK